MKRELSQQEIDAFFDRTGALAEEPNATPCDFSRVDRIPKSQLRAIHLLHEEFVRALSSTLSVYLRTFVRLNLVSLEQIPYAEFVAGISSPTCIAYANIAPYDATAMIELTPSIVAPLIELLLGGTGATAAITGRKITEIEKGLIGAVLKVLLHDLAEAWRSVADVKFSVQSLATEPEMFHAFAPMEGVIAIAIDVVIGQSSGLLNLAVPSIFVKRLRHRFEHVRELSRARASSGRDQEKVRALLDNVTLRLDIVIDGGMVDARTLLDLNEGDVIGFFGSPIARQPEAVVNDTLKIAGSVVQKDNRLLFQVGDAAAAQAQLKDGKKEQRGA